MIKIAHLTSVHPVKDMRIFYKECLSLKKMGYNVTLIAQAEKDSIIEGIQLRAIKKTRSRFMRMTFLLWQIYHKALDEEADIYHFHDPELILVGILLRKKRKKVIYDIHEDVPRDILLKAWIPSVIRTLLSHLFEKFEQRAVNHFQAVVTVTPRISERFSSQNAVEIRNYPDITEFQPQTSFNDSRFLCYAGLINLQRGIFEMIQSAKQSDLSLFLAGKFSSEQLKKQIIFSNPHVHYLGHVDRKRLHELYQKSLVGLALLHSGPTFNDSLPIKLFEYMAAGLPVIASDFPLWRDIIEKHQCGFCVNPHDLESIAEKISFLKSNRDVAQEMGARGQQAVKNFYNWQSQSEKLAALYKRLVN